MRSVDPNWPIPSSAAASAVMVGNRGRDTRPEVALRSLLHRRGLRFRKSLTIRLGGRRWTQPDVAFPRERLVVYVDGCFWHKCPVHGVMPRANVDYWAPKLERNVARDRDTDRRLAALGWTVIRAWEHDAPEVIAQRVVECLENATAPSAGKRSRPCLKPPAPRWTPPSSWHQQPPDGAASAVR